MQDVLDRYQEHFKYILIDEYQDTNEVQYKLSKLLAQKYQNIFVIHQLNFLKSAEKAPDFMRNQVLFASSEF